MPAEKTPNFGGFVYPSELGDEEITREREIIDTREREIIDKFNRSTENGAKVIGVNPKDKFGSVKVSISKLPVIGIIHGAHAMVDGAEKYGPYNWRDKQIIASIYIDAAMRHLMDWFEGQETATDSEVHHLGHAIACCAILLDAQETGNLIDDRPIFGNPDVADKVLVRISEIIKRRRAAKETAKSNPCADILLNKPQPVIKMPGTPIPVYSPSFELGQS